MSLLEVKNAAFAYPAFSETFSDVSFTVRKGQVFTILGPNGAGKSTLLGCLAGLNKLSAGQILLGGRDIGAMSRRDIARLQGFVPQTLNSVYAYSVAEYVVMGRAPYISSLRRPTKEDYAAAFEAIETMGVGHLAARSFSELSGGERQQVAIARILVQNPQLILLDEPTSALDFGNQIKVVKMVRELSQKGYSVIMTTHNPDHAVMLDDTIGILDGGGHMRVGTAAEILTEECLSAVYHTEVKVSYVEKVNRNACLAVF
ncbi:iron complex transport system ATP-binding protein [Sporobacter termitidis DSM 10068]|uniref:Iron complex transport system ATP-binding protein n=1 Tax=Sporobacter termitidis DSM 10068 TaxID=1123282 RepID=A0A1M5WDH6_9FIRM|nr:ABC transporter ATP-binding protein [Sporobacter termitidis]SHH85477.1 iron complex transport system ATP-binding protein [Sporobacter termitidis DSM 10068]